MPPLAVNAGARATLSPEGEPLQKKAGKDGKKKRNTVLFFYYPDNNYCDLQGFFAEQAKISMRKFLHRNILRLLPYRN